MSLAEMLDSRGRESAVEGFIKGPQRIVPAPLETTHLKALGAPAFEEGVRTTYGRRR